MSMCTPCTDPKWTTALLTALGSRQGFFMDCGTLGLHMTSSSKKTLHQKQKTLDRSFEFSFGTGFGTANEFAASNLTRLRESDERVCLLRH